MDAMSLWGLNQSTPVISYLARSTKADEAISASPYTLSMAQSSVRGACGFVLVAYPEITLAIMMFSCVNRVVISGLASGHATRIRPKPDCRCCVRNRQFWS